MCVGSEREPKGWRELGAALAATFRQQELWSQSFVSNRLYCAGDNPVFGGNAALGGIFQRYNIYGYCAGRSLVGSALGH